MLWIITDTHLGHYAMIKRCGRPENFDAIICRNWRERVKPQDKSSILATAPGARKG